MVGIRHCVIMNCRVGIYLELIHPTLCSPTLHDWVCVV
jgi:hypothetical protein